MSEDEQLLRRAEQVLSELDRSTGLIEEHAEVLAALRIRIYGAPKKTLDEVLKAAGDIKGRKRLENLEAPKTAGSLEDAFKLPEKKVEWPTGDKPKPKLSL
ncbi:MAG TPA: hypothetical protein VHJ78_12495 [Actinomycetota bacterium]|nr:hypothetical protein [Actinomycetota bacterium]